MKTLRLFLGLSLIASASFAQSNTINSHTFSFSDTLETVQVEDALGPKSELAKHRFLLRGSYDFVNQSLIGIDPTRTTQTFTVVRKMHSAGVGAGWMITKRFLVGFELPIHYVRLDQTYLTLYNLAGVDTTKWTLGDLTLRAKWRLTNDSSKINFALAPYVYFPTGNDTYFVTDDSYGMGGKFLIDFSPLPILTFYGNAGYTYAKNAEYLNIDRTKRVELAAGAYVKVIGDKLGGNAELINSITFPGFEDDQNPIAIRLGFRAKTGVVRWFFGGALEGLREARSNDISLYAGMKMPLGTWDKKETPPPVVEQETITVEKKIEILKENLSIRREINFETAKDIILPASYPELDSAAEIINKYGQYIGSITIEGHTDSRGSVSYNQDLSERRANSVRTYLIGKGVPAEKLKAVGYGESRPKVKEISPETLLINRRVEFKVDETIEIQKPVEETTTSTKKKIQ